MVERQSAAAPLGVTASEVVEALVALMDLGLVVGAEMSCATASLGRHLLVSRRHRSVCGVT